MRAMSFFVAAALLGCATMAEEPTTTAEEPQPVGNLAELMRAINFPNSNILFDVQSADPEAIGEKQDGTSVSATFSGIYKGWQMVEQAAIALAEVETLVLMPGRLCENGKPVPSDQEDFQEWARALTAAGKETLEAARKKDREAVSDLTNSVVDACDLCHTKYRRYEDRCRQ